MGRRGPKSAAELTMIAPVRSASAHDRPSTSGDQPPPEHLQPTSKAWWRGVVSNYRIEPHQLPTLQAAAEAWDRYQQARPALAEHGLTFTDDRGMARARPEIAVERDGRVALLRAVRELSLNVEPPKDHNARTIAWVPPGLRR